MSSNAYQSELPNGGPDPQATDAPPASSAEAIAPLPASDPEATDAPPASEPDPNLANYRPVNTEASPQEEISSELSDVDLRAVQSNEAKLAKEEGNRTFTMRELLNELKNGNPDNDDAREVDTPHRSVRFRKRNNDSILLDQFRRSFSEFD